MLIAPMPVQVTFDDQRRPWGLPEQRVYREAVALLIDAAQRWWADDPRLRAEVGEAVRIEAIESHRQWPQYGGGDWNGWQVVTISRDTKSKGGLAFRAGDITIAKRGVLGEWTAYSWRLGWNMGDAPVLIRYVYGRWEP